MVILETINKQLSRQIRVLIPGVFTPISPPVCNKAYSSNKESLKILKKINGKYARGLFQFRFVNKTGYGHGGSIDGFVSVFSYFPDKMISYAVTSNGINNLNMNDISIFILRSIYN